MRTYKTDVIEIKKRMAELKINTTKELAEQSGVGRNTLSKILNEEIQPSSDVMEKLAICLKLTPEQCGRIFFSQTLRTA